MEVFQELKEVMEALMELSMVHEVVVEVLLALGNLKVAPPHFHEQVTLTLHFHWEMHLQAEWRD